MLRLNAFHLTFSSSTFTAYQHELPDPSDLRELRERVKSDWFVHWKGGIAWGMPRLPSPRIEFGRPRTFDVNSYEGLSILAARASEQLQGFLPQYGPLPGKRRGFRFVARNVELVSEILGSWRDVPSLVRRFEIRPRFSCEARLAELEDSKLTAVLVVDISMRWQIHAELKELGDAGVDLAGLYIVRKQVAPGQRSLFGKIKSFHGDALLLSESYDDSQAITASDAWLEPTKRSFARCIDAMLGARGARFWQDFENRQSDFLSGNGFDDCLSKLAPTLQRHKGIFLGPDISISVGSRVDLKDVPRPKAVSYCFDVGKTKQHRFPWNGLNEYGPYDRESFPKRAPKLLVVCPAAAQSRVEQAVRKFMDGIPNSVYSKGFARTFHLSSLVVDTCAVSTANVNDSGVAAAYSRTVEARLQRTSDYDGALVVIEDQHSSLPDHANPYLFTKALLLTNGIPVQEARLTTVTKSDDALAWIFQNISVALYAKLGGIQYLGP
jgi:hypothetical protein